MDSWRVGNLIRELQKYPEDAEAQTFEDYGIIIWSNPDEDPQYNLGLIEPEWGDEPDVLRHR